MNAQLLQQGYFYITKGIFKSKASLKAIGLFLWLNSHNKGFKPSVNFASNKTHIHPDTYHKLLAEINANETLSGNQKDSYVQVPRIVMRDERLSLCAKALFAYFWTYEKEGLPDKRTIAKQLNISHTTFYKYIAELVNVGGFEFSFGGGKPVDFSKITKENIQEFDPNASNLFGEVSNFSSDVSKKSCPILPTIRIREDLKNSNQHTRCSESDLEKSKIASDFGLKILKFHFKTSSEILELAQEVRKIQSDLSAFNPRERELIESWFRHKRQRTGRKPTAENQKQDLKNLAEWKAGGADLIFILSECINRNYQGLYNIEKYRQREKTQWQINVQKMNDGKKRAIERARQRMANERANGELLAI